MPPGASTPTAVYVAAVPLRALKGPAQLLMSVGYSLGLWNLQHFMVLLRPDPARAQALVFDFQPRDPEDVGAALAVLSRSEIPGVVRRRTLRRIPDRRWWLVGHCRDGDAVGAADMFSERWPTGLVVGEHDCRDYTNGAQIGRQHQHQWGGAAMMDDLNTTVSVWCIVKYVPSFCGFERESKVEIARK